LPDLHPYAKLRDKHLAEGAQQKARSMSLQTAPGSVVQDVLAGQERDRGVGSHPAPSNVC